MVRVKVSVSVIAAAAICAGAPNWQARTPTSAAVATVVARAASVTVHVAWRALRQREVLL
jgi:hypothetical protein